MTDDSNLKQLGSPFAGPSSKPWLVPRPSGLISLVAFTGTVFFRAHYGQRCLNPKLLAKAALCFAAYMTLMRFYAGGWTFTKAASVPTFSVLAWSIFVALFFVYSTVQLFSAYRRKEMHEQEYSMSDGQPHRLLMILMPLVRDEWDFEKYYEPTIFFLLAGLLFYLHNWFGVYLLLIGLSAHHVARQKQNSRTSFDLDLLDGRISSSTHPNFVPRKPDQSSEHTIKVRNSLDDVLRED